MKIKYVCGMCGTMYDEEDKWMKCELSHGNIVAILPKFCDMSKFPEELIVYSTVCGIMHMSTYEWKKQEQCTMDEETYLLEHLKHGGYTNEKSV